MAFLTLNGITVEVALGSGGQDYTIVGDRRRTFDGQMLQTVTSRKRAWSANTSLMTWDESEALARFLLGDGHNWRFAAASDYYSGKGLGSTATNGTPTAGGASGKFDKRLTLDATEYVTWTPTGEDALTGAYTVACWWLSDDTPSDVWTHILVRYDGSATTYYTDGVLDGTHSWDGKLTVTAGVLKLLGEVVTDTAADAFSDLIALPFAVPTDWIPSLAAATRAFPNRPHVEVDGDAVGDPTTPIECCAAVEGLEMVPHVDSDGEQLDGRRVSFRLEEV